VNLRKMPAKKSAKFLILLLTSMLIATVSAEVYNYMYIQGSGVASTTKGLKWELGAVGQYPSGTTIDGFTVKDLNFSVAGSPINYTDCLHIVNQDGEAHNFTLRTKKSWGGWSDYTEFNLVVFNATTGGTQQDVLDLMTVNAQTGIMTIPAGPSTTWRILVEIVPIASPTGTQAFFEVELEYISSA
jgi:hypothetical protein